MAVSSIHAQLAWKVKLGSKVVLQTKGENENKNKVQIKFLNTDRKSNLVFSYHPATDEKAWVRTLMVDDSSGAGIIGSPEDVAVKKTKTEICFTISNKQLREIKKTHHFIKIYYTSIPSDPAKAALVRVRKVHVCTIIF